MCSSKANRLCNNNPVCSLLLLHLELSLSMRDKQEQLEQEVLRYKEQVSALQDRLDSVSKVCFHAAQQLIYTFCVLSLL